jgi:membrane protease YdiL (CAAX protease family)
MRSGLSVGKSVNLAVQERGAMKPNPNENKAETATSVQVSRREQALEVSVFLFLIVPSMVLSFFAVKQGTLGFALTAVATIMRDLGLLSLILFLIWRNREPISRIGWTFRNGWRDIPLGILLSIPMFYGAILLEEALQGLGFSVPATPTPSFLAAKGMAEIVLAVILVFVVAVTEETIFRGYLMLRFEATTSSRAIAVLLSAAIFALGHGYEGSAGVVTVGAMGLAFALVYLWRKSLVAPIVMHFVQDFVTVVLVALLGGR